MIFILFICFYSILSKNFDSEEACNCFTTDLSSSLWDTKVTGGKDTTTTSKTGGKKADPKKASGKKAGGKK